MRSIEKIKIDIDATLDKLSVVANQIKDKSASIEKLKADNSALVELHLGKARQPPSLQTQRQKIVQEGLKIEELENVQVSLNEKLEKLNEELKLARLEDKALQTLAGIDGYVNAVQIINNQILEMSKALGQLENSKHSLQVLSDLLHEIKLAGKSPADYGIDTDKIKQLFVGNLVTVFDGDRIENLNITGQIAFNQFDSAVAGRRGYSVAKKIQRRPEQIDTTQNMNVRLRKDPAFDRNEAFRKSLLDKNVFEDHTPIIRQQVHK